MILLLVIVVLFVLVGVWVVFGLDGFVIMFVVDIVVIFNLFKKEVVMEVGVWMNNYGKYLWMVVVLVLGILGGLVCVYFLKVGKGGWVFVSSLVMLVGVILIVGFFMFLFLMFSVIMFVVSLIVWDVIFSLLMLKIMFGVVCIFVFIVFGYIVYGFYVMCGCVKNSDFDLFYVIY